jgi:ribulose-phosphate 3-epimerase
LGIDPAESGALWCLDAAAAARLRLTGRGALAETEIVGRGLGRTRIAPSILAADFGRLAEQVAEVERCGADRIHADVMDGHFVPNISFGPLVVKALRPRTPLPLECHLMIEEPERYMDAFAQAGAASIQVHVEQQPRTAATLERIRGLRLQTGLVVNPGTPASAALPLLSQATTLLVMSVQPGFGGQAFLPSVLPKVRALRDAIDAVHPGCELEIDGGIDPTTAGEAVLHGARVLVAGSSVFHEKAPPAETLARLREGIP